MEFKKKIWEKIYFLAYITPLAPIGSLKIKLLYRLFPLDEILAVCVSAGLLDIHNCPRSPA